MSLVLKRLSNRYRIYAGDIRLNFLSSWHPHQQKLLLRDATLARLELTTDYPKIHI